MGRRAVIRTLMRVNGALAARALVMGPYLRTVAAPFSARVAHRPLLRRGHIAASGLPTQAERLRLRGRLGLPAGRFLVLLSSRISHEKDPESCCGPWPWCAAAASMPWC